jgi:GNAT superfamily N-acetyltransferase
MTTAIQFREAVESDYMAFARLFPQLQTHDQPPGQMAWQRDMVPSTLMVEHAGQIVGYAFFQLMRREGYVRHLVVDTAWRNRGIGRETMRELAQRMLRAGCTKWCLNVEPCNEPAVGLYRAMGMKEVWKSTAVGIKWTMVDSLPFPAFDVRARLLREEEDAAVERAFGLPQGQIADARAVGSRHLIRLVRHDAPDDPKVGLAVFDPDFPGAFPFRLAHAALVRPLLEGIRLKARADLDYVRIVVEDHEELSALLIGAGADVVLHALHMQGDLDASC